MFNQSTFPISADVNKPNDNTYAAAASNVNPYKKFLAAEAFVNISPIQTMTSNLETLLHYYDSSASVNHLNNLINKSNNNEAVIETPLPPPPPPLISALSTTDADQFTATSTPNITADGTISDDSTTFVNNNSTNSLTTTTTLTDNTSCINANELYEGNNNTIISTTPLNVSAQDGERSESMPMTTTSSSAIDNSGCHLRKNTPIGLPLIIKQAIENKSKSPIPNTKKCARLYQSASDTLSMAKFEDPLPPPPPPPETPSIESAPLSIDFHQQFGTNKQNDPLPPPPPLLPMTYENVAEPTDNTELLTNVDDRSKETDFETSIDALRLDDDKLSDSMGNSSSRNDDEDMELQEYNSANYWYVSPELDLDFHNLDLDLDDWTDTSKKKLFY